MASRRPAGYLALVERFHLEVIPNWHQSYVAESGLREKVVSDGGIEETFPASYWPGDGLVEQLIFALKYDGANLGILAALFAVVDPDELASSVASAPLSKYARRIWFFYEYLTEQTLPVVDLDRGNYVDLLDAETEYVALPARRVARQRINDNLLGVRGFCPTIRRTEELRRFESSNMSDRCRELIASHSREVVARALSYLYTKETKSSFELERERPSMNRVERFVSLLQTAEKDDFCDHAPFVRLQNQIVEERFRCDSYRTTQNYVGQTVGWGREHVHFVCPKPADVLELMNGLIAAHRRMNVSHVPAVVHAAAIAYGFVFLHPFDDGNGRIHRFLIHNVLARRGFTPEGLIFPVSAAMLQSSTDYDASLEAFSRPLLACVDYELDEQGQMTVRNETARYYRYPDLTAQTTALYRFIERTIDTVLVRELTFLENYDRTKAAIQEIVDLPDRRIDLFIRFVLQNHGRLSARKRSDMFAMLSDEEIAGMERAVQLGFGADQLPD